MKRTGSWPVKLTAPTLPKVVARRRLFDRLDQGLSKSVIWITGPPGSGKTTLAASYLKQKKIKSLWYQLDPGDNDPANWFDYLRRGSIRLAPRNKSTLPVLTNEHLANLSVFSEAFFEQLYGRTKSPYLLVYDNYHELSLDSPFHPLFGKSIEALPLNASILVFSRDIPPSALIEFLGEERMEKIDFSDLQFQSQELCDLLQLHKPGLSQEETSRWMKELQDRTQGWVAGVILSLASDVQIQHVKRPSRDTHVLFDYFATEVLHQQGPSDQELLLKLALLPSMTTSTATAFTRNPQAGPILERLAKRGYFTERRKEAEVHFQFHPRFREFLRTFAQVHWEPSQWKKIQEQAAAFLESKGLLEDAMALYEELKQWEKLLKLVLLNAPNYLAAGRVRTLTAWLDRIPKKLSDENPWCRYWKAACVMTIDPEASVPLFEEAFERFQRVQDQVGILMAWCGVVQAIQITVCQFSRLDPWIDFLENYLESHPEFPSKELEIRVAGAMFGALLNHRFNHDSIKKWEQKVRENIFLLPDVMTQAQFVWQVYNYRTWSADYTLVQQLLDQLNKKLEEQPDVINARSLYYALQGDLSWMKVDSERCLHCYRQAQQLIDPKTAPQFDIWTSCSGAAGYVLSGQIVKAQEICENIYSKYRFAPGMGGVFANYFMAWMKRLAGDLPQAMRCVEQALEHQAKVEISFFENVIRTFKVQLHLDLQEWDQANSEQHQVKRSVLSNQYQWIGFIDGIGKARLALLQGHHEQFRQAIANVLRLSKEYGCMFWIGMIPEVMSVLCNQALVENIEESQTLKIISALRLSPPPEGGSSKWPYPIRIKSLGDFEVVMAQNQTMRLSNLTKRQLLFLKVLLAFGGIKVPQDRIADILWPDAEGDRAYRSFIVMLTRVRAVLGTKQAILLEDGLVSLNLGYCWADVMVFQQRLRQADKKWEEGKIEESLYYYEQARELYGGIFLPHDMEATWAESAREQLQNRYQLVVDRLRVGYEQNGQWGKAVEVLEQAEQITDHGMR